MRWSAAGFMARRGRLPAGSFEGMEDGRHRRGCGIPGGRNSLVRILWAVVWLAVMPLRAEEAAEILFHAALRAFEVGQWEQSAEGFARLTVEFPEFEGVPEAREREAFARAETAMATGDFASAAARFAAYRKAHPGTRRSALAAVREATCRLRLGDRAGAIAVLEEPEGAFGALTQSGEDPAVLFAGWLLKAEALRGEQRLADAEAVLAGAGPSARTPAEQWARLEALAAVQEAAGRLEAAAESADTLSSALADAGPGERSAAASALAGRLWRRAGNPERADTAFSRNLAAGIPEPLQREAVLHLADSAVARGDFSGALGRIQSFLQANPEPPDAPAFRLRLGQALLRSYLAAGGPTNAAPEVAPLLGQAAAAFDAGLGGTASPDVTGMLHLGRGWVLWYEAGGGGGSATLERLRLAASHFVAAAASLPTGHAQATARFKLGDVLLRLREPVQALTNYLAVASQYPSDTQVQSELVERALQQAVLSAVEARDASSAQEVVDRLLARQPGAATAGDSTLTVAQALSRSGNPNGARAVLQRFLKAYPESPEAADAELLLASLDLRAGAWSEAIAALDVWLTRHTNHPSATRVEFDRAWAMVRAGASTNAIAQFAALAARYPTNVMSEAALLWIAGHHHSLGNFSQAGAACVSILTNAAWQGSPAWHQARLWAAEAARGRQNLTSAREQLTALLNDRTTPDPLRPAAYFALGEIQLEESPPPGQSPLQSFQVALEAFTAAAQYTNSPLVAAALGKMADCHLQLATRATNSYAKADDLYRRVLETPAADVSARTKAAFGRAIVAEKRAGDGTDPTAVAARSAALRHYLEIVNGELLRPGDVADPWWIKEAGREAGRLLESSARWQDAVALYERLALELPSMQVAWERRAAEARKRSAETAR